jgi:hypothetical protein
MAKSKATFDVVLILQILLAVFLITMGIAGIANYNTDLAKIGREFNRFIGKSNNPLNLLMAILELAAGVVVAGALFLPGQKSLVKILTLAVAVLWIVQVIISLSAGETFKPDAAIWLNKLSGDLVILAALVLVNRKYA